MERIVAEWRRRGVTPGPPAPAADVARTFAAAGRGASADVLALYRAADGFLQPDVRCWWLWPLDRVREVNAGAAGPFILFADWMMQSHVYALRREGPETSSVHILLGADDPDPYRVADSLSEFLEKLLHAPDEVEAWKLGG